MAKKLKEYFDKELLNLLSDKIIVQYSDFDRKSFTRHIVSDLENLELKDRVKLIGQSLYDHLPGDYTQKILLLSQILGPENKGSYGTFNDYFWQWCFSSVVEQYGLKYREASMNFIYELTKRSTGEFAMRPFLLEDPSYVLERMKIWSRDKNFHVRRLASEGLRPLLPWAKKCSHFVDRPKPIYALLKRLNTDSERYVVNSVANHMGDMLKLNYSSAMKELITWANTDHPETRWLIRHALRNLRKKGDQEAIRLTNLMSK